jgi:fumarate reductase iron-sulfur subunit
VSDEIEVEIFRGRGGEGDYRRYRLPRRDSQTVLDVVSEIQRRLAPDLAYRFACRVGMFGTCAMTVNGVPRWTCRSHVDRVAADGRLVLGPLRNLPHIRDLAVDLTPFFEKWQAAGGVFRGREPKARQAAPIDPASPERLTIERGIECIGCAVCHAACDVVAWRPDYLGPAALNRVRSLQLDPRHAAQGALIAAAAGRGGCLACHSQGSCTRHCPKALDPSASVAELKASVVRGALTGGYRGARP